MVISVAITNIEVGKNAAQSRRMRKNAGARHTVRRQRGGVVNECKKQNATPVPHVLVDVLGVILHQLPFLDFVDSNDHRTTETILNRF
jgi:hypothetical protein